MRACAQSNGCVIPFSCTLGPSLLVCCVSCIQGGLLASLSCDAAQQHGIVTLCILFQNCLRRRVRRRHKSRHYLGHSPCSHDITHTKEAACMQKETVTSIAPTGMMASEEGKSLFWAALQHEVQFLAGCMRCGAHLPVRGHLLSCLMGKQLSVVLQAPSDPPAGMPQHQVKVTGCSACSDLIGLDTESIHLYAELCLGLQEVELHLQCNVSRTGAIPCLGGRSTHCAADDPLPSAAVYRHKMHDHFMSFWLHHHDAVESIEDA